MNVSEEPDPAAAPGQSIFDEVTGLPNRAGWESVLDMEERRCRRYGGNPGVVAVDVKGPLPGTGELSGPELLRLVAETLGRASRDTDAVARVGERRFAVLATEGGEAVYVLEERLRRALEEVGVVASVRARARRSWTDLGAAWRQAESAAGSPRWVQPGNLLLNAEPPCLN